MEKKTHIDKDKGEGRYERISAYVSLHQSSLITSNKEPSTHVCTPAATAVDNAVKMREKLF